MNKLIHIRREIFGVTQVEMATICGVRQATISRWESSDCAPSLSAIRRMRAEALRRGLSWSDAWLFEEVAA